MCGQYQQGLSAVLGSSQCKMCSSIYLLLIIPIAVAGIALVIELFVLNLTVTNRDINAFLDFVTEHVDYKTISAYYDEYCTH